MSFRAALLTVLAMVMGLLLSFNYAYKQLNVPWVQFLFQSDLLDLLEHSEEDQKTLASLDAENETIYHQRFSQIRDFRSNLQILEHNQQNLQNTLNRFFLLILAILLSLLAAIYLLYQQYVKRNLESIKMLLENLLHDQDVTGRPIAGRPVKGVFRRMETMIRDAARLMVSKDRKIKTLNHLSSWQESARRHAHEIKTPLTAAHLELERLERTLVPLISDEAKSLWHASKENIFNELDRLKDFTKGFSTFGKLNTPRFNRLDLNKLISDFIQIYQGVFSNLELVANLDSIPAWVMADKDLVRQVWVNLVQNSAQALEEGEKGMVTFSLKMNPDSIAIIYRDNGPGIEADIKERIFEPYVTTKAIGQGMGLGMAISKKIMLDHGGDLDLGPSKEGASFIMSFPPHNEEN